MHEGAGRGAQSLAAVSPNLWPPFRDDAHTPAPRPARPHAQIRQRTIESTT